MLFICCYCIIASYYADYPQYRKQLTYHCQCKESFKLSLMSSLSTDIQRHIHGIIIFQITRLDSKAACKVDRQPCDCRWPHWLPRVVWVHMGWVHMVHMGPILCQPTVTGLEQYFDVNDCSFLHVSVGFSCPRWLRWGSKGHETCCPWPGGYGLQPSPVVLGVFLLYFNQYYKFISW